MALLLLGLGRLGSTASAAGGVAPARPLLRSAARDRGRRRLRLLASRAALGRRRARRRRPGPLPARRAAPAAAGGLAPALGPLGRGAPRRGRRDRGRRVGPDLEVHPPRRAQPGPLRLPARQPRPVAQPARGARDLAGQRVRRDLRRSASVPARRPSTSAPPWRWPRSRPGSGSRCASGALALPAAALAALAVWALPRDRREPLRRREGAGDRGAAGDRGRRCAGRSGRGRGPLLALGLALLAGGALSSFLILRSAPVGPTAHADQLEEIRAEVQGEDVLFLGRDDFIGWELARLGRDHRRRHQLLRRRGRQAALQAGGGRRREVRRRRPLPAPARPLRLGAGDPRRPGVAGPAALRGGGRDPRLRALRADRRDGQAAARSTRGRRSGPCSTAEARPGGRSSAGGGVATILRPGARDRRGRRLGARRRAGRRLAERAAVWSFRRRVAG